MDTNDTTPSRPTGPVVLHESCSFYLIKLEPASWDRVYGIPSRQWDGSRQSWVFPKTTATFDALKQEFGSDNDEFTIHPPESELRVPDAVGPPAESDDAASQGNEDGQDEDPDDLMDEIEDMSPVLSSIQDGLAEHSRSLQAILSMQEQIMGRLNEHDLSHKSAPVEAPVVPVPPTCLDLKTSRDLEVFERSLIAVAYLAANKNQNFMTWVFQSKPLRRPYEFVLATHGLLEQHLRKITGVNDQETRFKSLILKAKDSNLIYDITGNSNRVFFTLKILNVIRNELVHPPSPILSNERMQQSILYLMNLSLIWERIVVV